MALQRSYLFVGTPAAGHRLVTDIAQAFIYLRSSLAKTPPVYEYGLEAYINQMLALLPRGVAWDESARGDFGNLVAAVAEEFHRISNTIVEVENDTFPLNATMFLPDWERVLGLPDDCVGGPQGTPERRAAVVTKLISNANPTPDFFVELGAAYGYAIQVLEFFPARVGRARIGDRINPPDVGFTWAVVIPGDYTQARRAVVGDCVIGDRLATWGEGSLECLIRQYKPAHTTLVFFYE